MTRYHALSRWLAQFDGSLIALSGIIAGLTMFLVVTA